MNKLFRLTWKYCLCFISIGFLNSCGGGGADKEVAKTESDTGKTTAPAQAEPMQMAGITSGYLDTLWTDSANFAKLKNRRLVLSFIFGQLDTLTLHGWSHKRDIGSQFDPDPDIRLIKGGTSQYTYGPGTYFGNEILQKDDVKNVQNKLHSEKAQYVIFVPNKLGNHIAYEIWVSKEKPIALDKKFTTPTGSGTNPSPPKNY